jgi:hypothetical protein
MIIWSEEVGLGLIKSFPNSSSRDILRELMSNL